MSINLRRAGVAGGFLVLLGTAFLATGKDSAPGSLISVAKGVWFREGEIKALGHCNNIIIEMKDYLIVVDANFPSGARAAMADAKKVSSKPVKYVFDTHHHGDHAYGNAVWTEAGATTLAYRGVLDEMNKYEPARWLDTAKSRKDVGDLHLTDAERPKQTFDKSPFVLKDETREVQFMHLGWAHTRGDGFVWLPKERVLATGDAVVNGPYNYTADGNIGNWAQVAANAIKLKPQVVLPGHGASGGMEILTGQKQFMVDLHQAAADAVKAGKTEDDFLTTKLPAADANWIPEKADSDLRDAYREVKMGKATGDLPHK